MNDWGAQNFNGDELGQALYGSIEAQLTALGRDVSATDCVLIADYVRLEKLKRLASADIEKRGLGGMESNGRQRYWKDNKSATLLPKYMEQQAKILKRLGLGGVEPAAISSDDADADGFDEI